MLPERFRPDPDQPDRIRALDSLRYALGLSDELFCAIIVQSDWATENLQRKLHAGAKASHPEVPDREIFRGIIVSRSSQRIPMGLDITEDEVEAALDGIRTIDQLVEFVMAKEREEGPSSVPLRDELSGFIDQIMATDGDPSDVLRTPAFAQFVARAHKYTY